MDVILENINELDKLKKKLGQLLNEDNSLKQEEVKISLLNVDSFYRNTQPKNILDSNNDYLPNNPIYTKKGSSVIRIHYPGHNFNEGDKITINNVSSIDQTLSNSFFLFNKLNYLIIKLNHNIPTDYKQYCDKISVDLKLISKLNSSNDPNSRFYSNIPINMLIGIKTIKTLNDITGEFSNENINLLSSLYEKIFDRYNDINNETDIYNNFLFIELDFKFVDNNDNLYKINHVYNLQFLQLNGILLNKINSDYPINNERQQGFLEIDQTDDNNIWVSVNSLSYLNGNSGGSKVSIFKIIKTISGYPNAGEFTINLRKNFTFF